MVAAAVAGAAVAGVAGSVVSSSVAANGAKSAAKTQAGTAQAETAQQVAAGNKAYNADLANAGGAANLLAPYAAQGQTGLNYLNSNLNYLTTPYAPTQAQLEATPGYQFTRYQGLQSTQNAAAAQGLGVSGSALKSAAAYATGLAQNTYAQDAGIYQTNQQQIGNLLTGLADNGQNAANAQAQIIQTGQANASNALTGQSNAAAGTALTGASAQAAGTVGASNALASGVNSATSGLTQAALLNSLLSQNGAGSGAGSLTSAETPFG